ncbi:MAG: DNA polymerase III subunit delta [Candidatus Nanopelagicales bacterium]
MLPSLTLVLGSEPFLVDRAVAATLAQARESEPDVTVYDIDPERLAPGLLTGLAAPSLFGDRNIVILRRSQEIAAEHAPEVVHVVADPGDAVIVIAHSGAANRGKAVLEAAKAAGAHVVEVSGPTTARERREWLKADARAAHRMLTDDGADMLIEAVGLDLRELANALAQLVADTDGGIDAAVVGRYYSGRAEVKGYEIADAAVSGRPAEALEQLRFARATGLDPVPIVAAVASSLRTLIKLSGMPRGMRDAEVARDLRVPPWKVRILRDQLVGWSSTGLAEAIRAMATADEAVKGGVVREAESWALEHAVLTVARARR